MCFLMHKSRNDNYADKHIICVSHHQVAKTGAHYRFDRLVKGFLNSGIAVTWLSPLRADFLQFDELEFLKCKKTKKFVSLKMFFGALIHWSKIIQMKKKISWVITFGETNLISAYLISLITGSKFSIGVRSNIDKRFKEEQLEFCQVKRILHTLSFVFKRAFIKFIYKKADQIVVQTISAQKEFSKAFCIPFSKIGIVNNDIPVEFIPNPPIRKTKSIETILYIGNHSRIKGFDILLAALPHLKKAVISLRETIIVGVNTSYIKSNTYQNLEYSLTCFERTRNIVQLMIKSDILVVPSREDQFPNVVLEAIATNLPVIGSRVDGIEYILNNDELLFNAGDVNSLIKCLNNLTSAQGYQSALNSIAEIKSRFCFDWEKAYIETIFK